MLGFIPLTTLKSEPSTLNSTITLQPLLLIELTSCDLDMFLWALPNKANDNASNIVDLPEPLCPTTNVVGEPIKSISDQLLPVERKFFHFNDLNVIMLFLKSELLSLN